MEEIGSGILRLIVVGAPVVAFAIGIVKALSGIETETRQRLKDRGPARMYNEHASRN